MRGILDRMFNLRCEAGHRWYSPTPESFVGRACSHRDNCRHKLERIAG